LKYYLILQLSCSFVYLQLSCIVQNTIDGVNLTTEINQNSDDYLFFFAFTDDMITSPAGDGNIDNRPDPLDYNDQDNNGLPVGLSTAWETECTEESAGGDFRILFKYQPGIKSATSSSMMGTTEFDITWNTNVNEDPDAPPCENEEEIITDVTLTFTPIGGGTTVTASAQDPDGPGPLPLQILNDIELVESTEYEMSITLFNSIENEDITEEIEEEADEHMFFFEWTNDIFASPTGNGNVDNRPDPVNYNDFDGDGLPVGDLTWNLNTLVTSSEDIESLNAALKIAPNPVTTELSWLLEEDSPQPKEILIYDQFGRILHLEERQQVNGWTSINVDILTNGVYYLQIRSAEKNWIQRFIKAK